MNTYLHRVRSEDDGAVFSDPADQIPHESPCLRIHPSRGLIQIDDRRITNEGDGKGKAALVAARISTCKFVSMGSDIHHINEALFSSKDRDNQEIR